MFKDHLKPLLPQPFQQARYSRRRRANTLGEDEDKREESEEEARRGRQNEMDQANQVARRAVEIQRIEDELQARVEAAERAAAAVGHPDLEEEEEVQWENRMAKLREMEDAVLQ